LKRDHKKKLKSTSSNTHHKKYIKIEIGKKKKLKEKNMKNERAHKKLTQSEFQKNNFKKTFKNRLEKLQKKGI
jgi:hypothetical protein